MLAYVCNRMKIRLASLLVAALVLALGVPAWAQDSFSFLALGDTRTEPYLPGGRDQAAQMKKILKNRFHAAPTVLKFSSDGRALVSARLPYHGGLLDIYYRNGWPETIVRSHDGRSRVVMRAAGRKWVFHRVVDEIVRGQAEPGLEPQFIVHGGDMTLNGFQGTTLDESPYWQLFSTELLSRLPPPDEALGLPGRVLAAVGNHETWDGPNLAGMIETLPWLGDLGFSAQRRIYALKYQNSRFIFLDSGGHCSGKTCWNSRFPPFAEQMKFLVSQLKTARQEGARHVFVVYHKPSFVRVGHDPLPAGQNPHPYMVPFARDFNIIVLNSHTHTTEQYRVDGINYLVLGAGGAPQKFKLTKHPSQEAELYWNGAPRVEEYNYLQVEVDGPRVRGVLKRFRPQDPLKPFTTYEMFNLAALGQD